MTDTDAPKPMTCRDCGLVGDLGYHGTPDGTSCDPCWRIRQRYGWEFDGRTLLQLHAAHREAVADGEDHRGGESRAFDREQQAECQRLK